MIKTHFQDDCEFPEGSDGLTSFLQPDSHNITKSASAAIDRETVNRFKPDRDHVAVHLVAMGGYDRYSANRNHDGWPEDALRKYHPTFVSHGNLFREHQNKDPRKRIGIVKHAAYNEPMARVELIVWMDKKAAADECQTARDGKELSFSMSAKMKSDRCSICNNRARHQKLYCSHLKNHLGRYLPEMRKYAHAMNDENLVFFDISKVKNRADRVAAHIQYHFGDDMAKAASADFTMGGADLAAAMGHFETDLFREFDHYTLRELRKAAAYTQPSIALEMVPDSVLKALREYDLRNVLGELSKRACLLDIVSFTSLITGKPQVDLVKDAGFSIVVHKSADCLPDMCSDCGCECGDAGDMLEPDSRGTAACASGDSIDQLISGVEKNLGLSKTAQANRFLTGMPSRPTLSAPIITPDTPVYEGVAEAYKWYVAKAAAALSGTDLVPAGTFAGVLKATADAILTKKLDTLP